MIRDLGVMILGLHWGLSRWILIVGVGVGVRGEAMCC